MVYVYIRENNIEKIRVAYYYYQPSLNTNLVELAVTVNYVI